MPANIDSRDFALCVLAMLAALHKRDQRLYALDIANPWLDRSQFRFAKAALQD